MSMSFGLVKEDLNWVSLSWFIGGIISWRKWKIFPFYRSFSSIVFFPLSFKLQKELWEYNTESRFTIQFKVINTKKDQILPIFNNKCFGEKKKKGILYPIKILQEGKMLLSIIFYFVM